MNEGTNVCALTSLRPYKFKSSEVQSSSALELAMSEQDTVFAEWQTIVDQPMPKTLEIKPPNSKAKHHNFFAAFLSFF